MAPLGPRKIVGKTVESVKVDTRQWDDGYETQDRIWIYCTDGSRLVITPQGDNDPHPHLNWEWQSPPKR